MDAAPPVERRIATDLARHGLMVAPVIVLVAGLFRGLDGAASAALGLAVLVLNFLAAAISFEWGARRGGCLQKAGRADRGPDDLVSAAWGRLCGLLRW